LLLSNEAVLSRSEEQLIDSDVKDNLPFLAQQRLDMVLATNSKVGESAEKNVEPDELAGVNYQLMEEYKALDLDNNPIKVTYM
jgi:hypothetical protein